MKKINFILVVAFLAAAFFSSCKDDEPNSPAKIGVKINGVVWSPFNVGATGTFVSKSEDYGGIYQWNRKDTSNFQLNDDYFTIDYTIYNTWLPANDPSPAGWRVPTIKELEKLMDDKKVRYEYLEQNGISGIKFTDISNKNSIFLPLAGSRSGSNGILYYTGKYGYYWSNTECEAGSHYAYLLVFTGEYIIDIGYYKSNGFSVRPVAK